MGKILKTKTFTTGFEAVIVVVALALILGGVYWFAPGLRVSASKTLAGLELSNDNINNVTSGTKLDVPSKDVSNEVSNKPKMRIAEYAWNGNAGMIAANGGPNTTEGSLMEAAGVNLEIVRIDGINDLRNMQVKFVEEFDAGNPNPSSDKSAFAVSIMGDGGPFYATTTQKRLDETFGEGKYHVQAIGAVGLSYGEDKLIGPKEWRDNPQSMKGAVISAVIGDGDWVLVVNYAFANGLHVNPDPSTYDADAVNFVPAPNDDFIEAVKDLIKSQKTGYTVPLKVVKDGKLTGETVNKKIDGATTWTPGDKMAFDVLTGFTDVVTTREFVNQMATTIFVIKEWAMQNEKAVISMLKQSFVAANQIKQYDEWAVFASEAVCKTYNFETPKYWYDLFKGQKGNKAGLDYTIGGSRVFNYADAMQYYGITDGNNRYKSVYNQVSNYLTELNPCDFNSVCKNGVLPYEDAVNMYFMKSITDIDAGETAKHDYSETKTEVMASGHWNINFVTGSSTIQGSSNATLNTIYNLLMQAEDAKLEIVGHTDNSGNASNNMVLSLDRANSVVNYLVNKGISRNRFQLVDGKGQTEPIEDNKTAEGRAKNRRVDITLLK
jgi:outer membrane protein OmpA-like peptidoglycan-associated protein